MFGETDQIQQGRYARAKVRRRHFVKPAVKAEKFCGCQPIIKAEVLGEETDLAASGHISGRPLQHNGTAIAGRSQSQQDFHRGGLARPVRTYKAEHFAAPHFKREAADGHFLAIDFPQPPRLDGDMVGRRQ